MSVAPYEVRHSAHQQDGPSSGNYGTKPALTCSTLNRVMNWCFSSVVLLIKHEIEIKKKNKKPTKQKPKKAEEFIFQK